MNVPENITNKRVTWAIALIGFVVISLAVISLFGSKWNRDHEVLLKHMEEAKRTSQVLPEYDLATEPQKNFIGTGVHFWMEPPFALPVIGHIYKNSPAESAGLQRGDVIIKIDKEYTMGMTASQISSLLQGEDGSKVTIGIYRDSRYQEFTMVRSIVEIGVENTVSVSDVVQKARRQIAACDAGKYSVASDEISFGGNSITEADARSFEIAGNNIGGYAKDKNHVYYCGIILEGVDSASFQYYRYGYYKSGGIIYLSGRPLLQADPDTFHLAYEYSGTFVDKNYGYDERGTTWQLDDFWFLTYDEGGKSLGGNYREYKGEIYYWDAGPQAAPAMILINADPGSFTILKDEYCASDSCLEYAKDDKKVFHASYEVNGADPETFHVLKGSFAKDKNYVFYDTKKLEGIKPDAFESLGFGQYGKDDASVVYGDNRIDGADPKTFEVLHEKYCLAYSNVLARDKNSYYSRTMKITKDQYYEYLKAEADEIRPIIETCN